MGRAGLGCTLGLMGWSCLAAAGQSTPVGLPSELRAHVKDERLQLVTSVRGLPLGVRDALRTLFGQASLELAEPGTPFHLTDAIIPPVLPTRRMIAAGCSSDHCLVYYERGGRTHVWRAVLFHWTPAETRFEGGGTAPRNLATVDEIRNALLSGAVRTTSRF